PEDRRWMHVSTLASRRAMEAHASPSASHARPSVRVPYVAVVWYCSADARHVRRPFQSPYASGAMTVTAFIIALLIGLNALYVAGEFAAVSTRRTRVRQLAEGGSSSARWLLGTLEDGAALD